MGLSRWSLGLFVFSVAGLASAGQEKFPPKEGEAVLRKWVIRKAAALPGLEGVINTNERAQLDLALKQPIQSVQISNISLGKFSNEPLDRWGDVGVAFSVTTTTGSQLACEASTTLAQVNINKQWVVLRRGGVEDCKLEKYGE